MDTHKRATGSRNSHWLAELFLVMSALSTSATAQSASSPPNSAAPLGGLTAKDFAQYDITGYWVSVVTEDWIYRMAVPPKGDWGGIPLNEAGRKIALEWKPMSKDSVSDACDAYGAPAIVRRPGRIHIQWKDTNTLELHFEAGNQTRLLHFASFLFGYGFGTSAPPDSLLRFRPPDEASTLQGHSVAAWAKDAQTSGISALAGTDWQDPPLADDGGSLFVITTHLSGGLLLGNGVPYSEDATLTEHFDELTDPDGNQWLIVTSIVDDPKYLNAPYVTSTNFKREVDGAVRWRLMNCIQAAKPHDRGSQAK